MMSASFITSSTSAWKAAGEDALQFPTCPCCALADTPPAFPKIRLAHKIYVSVLMLHTCLEEHFSMCVAGLMALHGCRSNVPDGIRIMRPESTHEDIQLRIYGLHVC